MCGFSEGHVRGGYLIHSAGEYYVTENRKGRDVYLTGDLIGAFNFQLKYKIRIRPNAKWYAMQRRDHLQNACYNNPPVLPY